MKVILFISAFFLASCTSIDFKSRNVESYYQSSGVEKYFLSEVPSWANFSERGNCFRSSTLKFFDIDLLMKSFGINYSVAVQIQATFNDNKNHLIEDFKIQNKLVTLGDEQILFFKASEKVNGKIKFFEAPSFKRVNLIWIDSMLKNADEEKKVLNFLKSPINNEGVPVLVSYCLNKKELEAKFPDVNYKKISAEMLSIYFSDGTKSPMEKFNFEEFFSADQSLYFYSREKNLNNFELNKKIKFNNF